MCLSCGDADKGQKMKKALAECGGVLKPYMTRAQLVDDLVHESAKTGKKFFRIFKGILVNPPLDARIKKGSLTINFV